jgi:hypothetical protein
MTNKTIQQHIDDDRNELDNPNLNGQRRRHLESELESLEKYKETHPEDSHDPTPLELYCNDNPNALECRIYGD